MSIEVTFTIIGIVLVIGFLSEHLFRHTGIPDIFILMLIGIFLRYAIGVDPFSFSGLSEFFITFALIYILFQGALSIHFETVIKSMGNSLRLTFLSFILTSLCVVGVMYVFTQNLLVSTLIGTVLGGTSSMVVIPLIHNLKLAEGHKSSLTLESAISDVLCIIATLAVIRLAQTGVVSYQLIAQNVLVSTGLGALIGVACGFFWIFMLTRFKSLSHAYVVTIALIMLVFAIVESEFIGASGAIACLAFGLTMGNSREFLSKLHMKEPKSVFTQSGMEFFTQISFFLKVIFFVYLGLLIDFSRWELIVLSLIITIVMFLIRPLVVFLVFGNKLDHKTRTTFEVVIPKGLAAAVLAQFAATELAKIPQLREMSMLLGSTIFSVIFFSIVFTSILVFLTRNNLFSGIYHRHKKPLEHKV